MNKNLSFLLLCAISIFAGCQSLDIPDSDSRLGFSITESAKVATIRNYVKTKTKDKTRAAIYDITPYVISGDTVLYVVNYNGGGFEIFSNDYRLPMVLAKSETGSYYPNSFSEKTPFEEYINERAMNLHVIGKTGESEAEGQWELYAPKRLSNSNSEPDKEDEDGRFLGYAYDSFEEEYMPSGGRLATKWGQRGNYNQAMPYLEDRPSTHGATGCAPIMFGQYLLHSHKYFDYPTHMVTDAVYDASTNRYSFSGWSDTVWNLMDDGSNPDMPNNKYLMQPTSVMLGYIAKELDVTYEVQFGEGTSALRDNYSGFLNKHCGLNYKFNDFNTNLVKQVLTEGKPVLISSDIIQTFPNNTKYKTGHAYLIDYARYCNYTIYEVYSRDPKLCNPSPDEPDIDIEEESLEWYTSNFRNVYWYDYSNIEFWISMNWGWDGAKNNIQINAGLDEWIIKMENGSECQIIKSYILR